jgi:hypothetical protein
MTPEIRGELDAVGTFFVDVYHRCPAFDEVGERLPPHRLVLEPLLAHAESVRVYGLPEVGPIRDNIAPVARPRRGFTELTLSEELVRGHESFWNTGTWERGSVAILCVLDRPALAELLSHCSGPRIWSSLHQSRKGTHGSAIRYCQRAVGEGGRYAFLFSASNGIERMDLFCRPESLYDTYTLATERCRPFKRYCEHNPGRNEIIIDRPPYNRVD